MSEEHRFTVLLCGDSNVGKTTLARHYDNRLEFDHLVVPFPATVSVESFYTHYDLFSCDAHVHVYVQDMPGGAQNGAALPMFSRQADIFVFMYDMTERRSFDNLKSRWANYRDQYCAHLDQAVTILIGNKKDKVMEMREQRAVTLEEAKELARDLGAVRCFELSARAKGKEGFGNIKHALDVALAEGVYKRRRVRASAVNELDIFAQTTELIPPESRDEAGSGCGSECNI